MDTFKCEETKERPGQNTRDAAEQAGGKGTRVHKSVASFVEKARPWSQLNMEVNLSRTKKRTMHFGTRASLENSASPLTGHWFGESHTWLFASPAPSSPLLCPFLMTFPSSFSPP